MSDDPGAATVEGRRALARRLRLEGRSRSQILAVIGPTSSRQLTEWIGDLPAPGWTRRPRAKDDLRARCVALRLEGLTYDEIAARVPVSKSSLSLWLRDLPRPPVDTAAHVARMQQARRQRLAAERQAVKQAAGDEIGGLSSRDLFLVGVSLYWAEGSKDKPYARREALALINSDPGVIRVFLAWLDLLRVPPEDRAFRLSIHESADEPAAREFWSRVVGVPAAAFERSTLKRHNPSTVRHNVGADYRGCLIVRVRRSRQLYQRVEGWWHGIVAAAGVGSDSPSRVV